MDYTKLSNFGNPVDMVYVYMVYAANICMYEYAHTIKINNPFRAASHRAAVKSLKPNAAERALQPRSVTAPAELNQSLMTTECRVRLDKCLELACKVRLETKMVASDKGAPKIFSLK
jgi:hypothetical protein